MKAEIKPVVIPALKPRNPLGKQRKATIPHKDKRKRTKHKHEQKEYQ